MAGIKVWYDQEGDLLEVLFEDVPAEMEEISADLYERRSVDGRVVGFTVLNFSKHNQHDLVLPLRITAVPT